MRLIPATICTTLALLAGLLVGACTTPAPAPIPPCVTEDAPGPCRWDATQHGDGRGESFTVAPDGTVTYDAVPA